MTTGFSSVPGLPLFWVAVLLRNLVIVPSYEYISLHPKRNYIGGSGHARLYDSADSKDMDFCIMVPLNRTYPHYGTLSQVPRQQHLF